jgi:iron complex outermembrane receptor protein
MAALTLAARRDNYSDFGSASTYQLGAEIRPTKAILLRGSMATSFKPPTLLQTNVDPKTFTTDAYGLVDPTRANAPIVGGEVYRATNPDLNPEKGKAFSMGAVWEPPSAQGTRLGVTAWRVKIDGLISLLWPQVPLDNEALFPGFVTRAPAVGGVPGLVTRVFYSEVNFGSVETAGADMEISHAWKAAGAKWTLAASATRTTRYDVAVTAAAPVDHRLGRRAVDYWSPKWKGRLFAGVDQGAWSLGVTSRYLGAYQDMAPSNRSLGKFWVHDLAASLNLKRLGLGLFAAKEASLSLAIANVTDRLPEYVGTSPYYDVTQGDWRGRYANLRLSMNW